MILELLLGAYTHMNISMHGTLQIWDRLGVIQGCAYKQLTTHSLEKKGLTWHFSESL